MSEDGKLMTDEVWIVHGLEIYHAQKVSASDVYESVWASDPKYKVDMTMEEIDAAEQNFVDHTVYLDLIPFTQLERIA